MTTTSNLVRRGLRFVFRYSDRAAAQQRADELMRQGRGTDIRATIAASGTMFELWATPVGEPEGWGTVTGPRVAHYFRAGRSLCRRWAAIGGFHPYDITITTRRHCCVECWRKREREAAHDRVADASVTGRDGM